MSKEEWVISKVAEIVGTGGRQGFVASDDAASDILLELLNAGGFSWDEEEIVAFCKKRTRYMLFRYLRRNEKSECEFFQDDDQSDGGIQISILERGQTSQPMQEICMMATEARGLLKSIPDQHRETLEILCDGGNPIDVADEMNVTPAVAIALIREGRRYVNLVDPSYD